MTEALEAMSEADCERRKRCSGSTYTQVPGGCVAARRDLWLSAVEETAPFLENGHFVYEPSAAAACTEARRNAACDDPWGDFPAECYATFDGTVPPGGACSDSIECTGTASCRGCPGRCVAPSGTGERCDEERRCDHDSRCSEGTCAALARIGEPCNELTEAGIRCAGSGVCDGDTGDSDGECRGYRTVGLGEPCDIAERIVCEPNSACVRVELVDSRFRQLCRERSERGAECWSGSQDTCPVGQYCPLNENAQWQWVLTARCLPLADDGERCYSARGCGAGAACLGGVCVRRRPLGEPCQQWEECSSQVCVDGKCSRDDVCAEHEPSVEVLRDPPRPSPECPTKVAGALLESFDVSMQGWETYPKTGDYSVARVAESLTCSGALRLRVKLSEETPNVETFLASDDDGTWDTPRQRLHLWVRLGTPIEVDVAGYLWVHGWVARERGSTFTEVAASLLSDRQWHEVVVPILMEESSEVLRFGVGVYAADPSVADQVPRLDLYLDTVWVE